MASYDYSVFGIHKNANNGVFNPWQYASKRLDRDLSLIDFGKRYYDPVLGRWLSVDPAGFINGRNLYQYNFNNPFVYTDPDGQFVFLIPLLCGSFGIGALGAATVVFEAITAEVIIGAVVTGVITWGVVDEVSSMMHEFADHLSHPDMNQNNNTEEEAQKKRKSKGRSRRGYTHTYAPSRPLPVNGNGVHTPDADVPHTQLGTNQSEKRKYHKALYLLDCNMNAIDYHESQYKAIAKSTYKEVNNKKEEDVPVRVTIGVTAALAGYFLSFVPHPLVQTASRILIATGSGLCVEGTINRLEESEKINK